MKKLIFQKVGYLFGGVTPPAVIHGTAGATWGVTGETGIITQSFGRSVSRDVKAVKDEIGNETLVSRYNPKADYRLRGYRKAGGGLSTAAPADTLTILGSTSGNGVTAGLVILNNIDIDGSNEDFVMISANASQRPNITALA